MNDRDPRRNRVRCRLKMALCSADEDAAAVGLIDATKNPQQGRLPCAVLTNQSVYAAGFYRKCDPIECTDAREALSDFVQAEGIDHASLAALESELLAHLFHVFATHQLPAGEGQFRRFLVLGDPVEH